MKKRRLSYAALIPTRKHYEKTNLEAGIINKNDPISSMFLGRPLNEVYSVVDQSGELVRCYIDLI